MARNDFAEEVKHDKPSTSHAEEVASSPEKPAQIEFDNVEETIDEVVPVAPTTDVDLNETDENPRSTFNRNVLIGAAVAILLIALLTLMRHCNDSSNGADTSTVQGDSTAVATTQVTVPAGEALNIFKMELSRHNLNGDDALAMAATLIPGNLAADKPDRIVGVTMNNIDGNRSFIKVYVLDRSGSSWTPVLKQTKYFNGRKLFMSDDALRPEPGAVPATASVGGHDAMLFAMYNEPQGFAVGNTARVTMALYDLEADKLHLLDYDGVTKRHDDGKIYVHGKPIQGTSGPQMSFLRDAAPKVHVLYFPTEEELKAEQEEKERQEEEARKNDPDNAGETWAEENAEAMEQVNERGSASVKPKTYDKPIFNLRDNKRKLDFDTHLVFCDNEGKVYGFDKATRKYYVIYSASGSNAPASDISKGSRGEHDVEIVTASGTLHYDLSNNRLSH